MLCPRHQEKWAWSRATGESSFPIASGAKRDPDPHTCREGWEQKPALPEPLRSKLFPEPRAQVRQTSSDGKRPKVAQRPWLLRAEVRVHGVMDGSLCRRGDRACADWRQQQVRTDVPLVLRLEQARLRRIRSKPVLLFSRREQTPRTWRFLLVRESPRVRWRPNVLRSLALWFSNQRDESVPPLSNTIFPRRQDCRWFQSNAPVRTPPWHRAF